MYKVGDQIITREEFGNGQVILTVGKILNVIDSYGERLYECTRIEGERRKRIHRSRYANYISEWDERIQGLYKGQLPVDGLVFEPKYNIGDWVLVKPKSYLHHLIKTWFIIRGMEVVYRDDEFDLFQYFITDEMTIEEDDIVDSHTPKNL